MKNTTLELQEDIVLLGDLHFGVKRFSREFFENQLLFFTDCLLPYMRKNNLKTILQLGDIFDNRTTIDIYLLQRVREVFNLLRDSNIQIYSLTGNHDIYFRENRDTNLLSFFEDLYDNYTNYNTITDFKFYDKVGKIIPWIVKDEKPDFGKTDFLVGHFELQNYKVTPNSVMMHGLEDSKIDTKKIFSGHFHIQSETEKVHYIGTPYQIDWNDYREQKGFFILHKDLSTTFIENKVTRKYIKIKYDDTNPNPLLIFGLEKKPVEIDAENFLEFKEILSKSDIKFIVNKAKTKEYESFLFLLKEHNIDYTYINNQEISELTNTDFVSEENKIKSTKDFILETLKQEKPDLVPLMMEIFEEVQVEEKE